MKTRKIYITILIILISAFLFVNCSSENTTTVTINFSNKNNTAVEEKGILDRILDLFLTKAYAQSWIPDKTSVKILVEALDMSTIEVDVPNDIDQYVLVIPSGKERKITVLSFDKNNIRSAGGHATLDLNPGEVVTVTIRILPITDISVSTGYEVYIIWTAMDIYPECTGYKLYGSESAAGPYKEIWSTASCSLNYLYDRSGPEHVTYYYKLTVLTSTGEGEPSDYGSGYWDTNLGK